ncbi:uncharacterized protein BJ171DRAFT_516720 [Polychytrium aggregatum]|uniref:uncharacterized protein n=1 Tax=Polychytrium aggregatum TaxID=110093 RepID=UPI0022FE6244|nr:uncharacterized protein BJ171DRAFT_516720 [Polychytrium aggregatum]KAI9201848.1 hypothetical protein BJ171DRAFT_516720 [Polychytrium aggregatum]
MFNRQSPSREPRPLPRLNQPGGRRAPAEAVHSSSPPRSLPKSTAKPLRHPGPVTLPLQSSTRAPTLISVRDHDDLRIKSQQLQSLLTDSEAMIQKQRDEIRVLKQVLCETLFGERHSETQAASIMDRDFSIYAEGGHALSELSAALPPREKSWILSHEPIDPSSSYQLDRIRAERDDLRFKYQSALNDAQKYSELVEGLKSELENTYIDNMALNARIERLQCTQPIADHLHHNAVPGPHCAPRLSGEKRQSGGWDNSLALSPCSSSHGPSLGDYVELKHRCEQLERERDSLEEELILRYSQLRENEKLYRSELMRILATVGQAHLRELE